MDINTCRLNGISFADLPHISKGEEVSIVREVGEPWDSDARPAYSVRLGCMHIGYIPLVETLKEEALMARDGYLKKYKDKYQNLTREELRKIATELNEQGKMESFSEFYKSDDKEKTDYIHRRKLEECENTEYIRDWLFVEIMRNHYTPKGHALPVYFDEKHGRNLDEIGEICSISIRIDPDGGTYCNELAQMGQVHDAITEAMRHENK